MRETEQNHRRRCFQGEGRLRRCLMGTAVALTVLGTGAASAQAESLKALGDFGDWSGYVMTEGGTKVCFMASQPVKAEGNYTQRGDIHLLITHRPAQKATNEVSVVTGYPFKDGKDVEVAIGKKTWKMFSKGERAWAWDHEADNALVAAMRKGTNMVIKGTSERGTDTVDTYSLRGSSAAYEAISNACGVPVE
jgi:invasion protein IalB